MDDDVFDRDPDLVRLVGRVVVVLAQKDLYFARRGPASNQHIKTVAENDS